MPVDEAEEGGRQPEQPEQPPERPHQVRPEDYVVLLAQVPERVADIVLSLDEERLSYRHAPALPTIAELVAHVAQSGTLIDALFRHVLIDGATEVDLRSALEPAPTAAGGEDLLEGFARDRRRTVDLLRGLSPSRWAETVADGERGQLSLFAVCELVGRHEAGHLTQLRNLIAQLPETRDLGLLPPRKPGRALQEG